MAEGVQGSPTGAYLFEQNVEELKSREAYLRVSGGTSCVHPPPVKSGLSFLTLFATLAAA